jgi:hypothetical protein
LIINLNRGMSGQNARLMREEKKIYRYPALVYQAMV